MYIGIEKAFMRQLFHVVEKKDEFRLYAFLIFELTTSRC